MAASGPALDLLHAVGFRPERNATASLEPASVRGGLPESAGGQALEGAEEIVLRKPFDLGLFWLAKELLSSDGYS